MRRAMLCLAALVVLVSATASADVMEGCEACLFENCPLNTDENIKCWAKRHYYAGLPCYQAINKAARQLSDDEVQLIVAVFASKTAKAQCEEPSVLIRGALMSSLLVSKGGSGIGSYEHALQLMPSFSLGIPIPISDENDATRALDGSVTFGGIVIRYTPASYWVAVNLLIGTAEPASTSRLDSAVYTSPKLISYGFGLSALGNLLNVNLLWTDLRKNGFFSQRTATAQYVNIGIDLSALGFVAAGATK